MAHINVRGVNMKVIMIEPYTIKDKKNSLNKSRILIIAEIMVFITINIKQYYDKY